MPSSYRDRPLLAALSLVILGALMYLPGLARDEFDDEEGRRAWTAREMLARDDFVLPTIWGRPYLAKPPAHPWAIAACAAVRGRVDEWSTRLPSVLATIATALAVYAMGRRMAGAREALVGGVLYLCTIEVFHKGALGELEALLGLFTFLATGLLWLSVVQGARWILPAGLALGLALLTKGPPALVFFGSALLGLALTEPEARRRAWSPLWLPVLIGLVVAGVWVGLLFARPEAGPALDVWRGEMVDRGQRGWGGWLREHGRFVVGVVGGLFPGSLVLLLLGGSRSWNKLRLEPAFRFVLWAVGASLILLLVSPGVRARYAYPLTPWCALAAGWLIVRVADSRGDGPGAARLRWLAMTGALLGLGLAGASVVATLRPIRGVGPLGPLGYALCTATAALGVGTIRRRRSLSPMAASMVMVAVLCLGRLVQLVEVAPALAGHRGRVADARALEAWLPDGQALYTNAWGHFNELFYLDREVRFVEDPATVPAGEPVLVRAHVASALRAAGDPPPTVLAEPILEREQLVLLRWP